MCAKMFSVLAGVFMAVSFVRGNSVSFITPCKATDSKCIKNNIATAIPFFVKGIPELNIKTLDPLTLKKVDASRSGLKFVIIDGVVEGMKSCVPKKASRDAEKGKLFIKLQCDGKLDGQYELNGQLLILPIRGKGAVHAVLRKLVISAEIDLNEKVGEDGKKHWEIKNSKHSFELKDKADVVFENLFEGNEILGFQLKPFILSAQYIPDAVRRRPSVMSALNALLSAV
ncbi:uncharacterized protein LOC113229796 [Hyposmocoma kahamanoa]|uniref:uncharacterized protein LOC113229796 n=1 Tax=Hyposmocoma kahamanoa TaxID=1477025 RepID=UPI000E6D6265|nr:uncharacterized protein LOC113229796 [Hyposmocoma kahamanoa]